MISGAAISFLLLDIFVVQSLMKRWLELFSGQIVASAEVRIDYWASSWGRIAERPWFGSGVESIPHNSFLTTLEAFGLIFGGALIGFYCFLIAASWLTVKKEDSLLVVPVLMAFTVMSATAEFFYTTQLIILVVPLFMWVVVSTTRRPRVPQCAPG